METTSMVKLNGMRALLIAGAVALASCETTGRYTAEGASGAKQKMMMIRSGLEWQSGYSSFMAGDLDKALKAVDRSIALNEEVAKSHVLRGRIMMEKGDIEGGITSLVKGQAIDPESVEASYYQGIAFERLSQSDKALEHYKKAADLDPSNPQYAIAAAESLIDLKKPDEAREYLETRRAAFANNPGVRQTLGHIALLQGEHQKAIELFNEARLLAPDDVKILEDLARAQFLAGRYADAEYNLGRATEDPKLKDRYDLKHMQARALVEMQRPADAREILLALTRTDSKAVDPAVWADLGSVAYLLTDRKNLRQAWTKLTTAWPDRAEGYLLKGLAMRREGDLPAAVQSLERALVLEDSPSTLALLEAVRDEIKNPRAATPGQTPGQTPSKSQAMLTH